LWPVGRGWEPLLFRSEFPIVRTRRCNRSKPSNLNCVADIVNKDFIIVLI